MNKIDNREGWHVYFMRIAADVASRSTCLSRNYGAVIVRNNKIISTGYNGAAAGLSDCLNRGVCYRRAKGIEHGKNYDSNCLAVHAEANAIINADPQDMFRSTIYIYGVHHESGARVSDTGPCVMCYRMIRNAGISNIVVYEGNDIISYTTDEYLEKFKENDKC